MNASDKIDCVRSVAEEIITEEELRGIFETKTHPVAYDGFEPSGLAHLPFGLYRPLVLKELMKTGMHFTLFLADWHAWVNNKMGGDLKRIQRVGEYFIEVWKAAGVDTKKIKFVWASDLCSKPEYWKRVILIAKNISVKRATRALTIMGRKEGEMIEAAQYFYPAMQVADIFELGVDMTQLGLDQRRANILSREVAEKMKWKKPVIISHHMLMGLQGVKEPDGFESNKQMDTSITSKMSKSKPSSAIFVHDSTQMIKKKINAAFCEAKNAENNPVLDYAKEIVFRGFNEITVERPKKFGGDIVFGNYRDLEREFMKGTLHPLDLKNTVALYVDKMIDPIRTHFEKNKKAKELFEFVKKQEVTR